MTACRWSSARGRWEVQVLLGISHSPCDHDHPSPKVAATGELPNLDLSQGLAALINNYESKVIQTALKQYNDIDEVAKTLQISRSSLYKKIKDFNIDWKPS